jgi:hypothetical protein
MWVCLTRGQELTGLGVKGFDHALAWEAVRKNAFTPPDRDTELRYGSTPMKQALTISFEDREEHTPQEVRAGLTEYISMGYVADDLHSEAGSRTLDYACELPYLCRSVRSEQLHL